MYFYKYQKEHQVNSNKEHQEIGSLKKCLSAGVLRGIYIPTDLNGFVLKENTINGQKVIKTDYTNSIFIILARMIRLVKIIIFSHVKFLCSYNNHKMLVVLAFSKCGLPELAV